MRSCNQLGGLVLLAGLPRQLPGDDEVEPGADEDRRCLVAAQWMDVFKGFYLPGVRGRRRSRDHGRRLAGMRRRSVKSCELHQFELTR